jgi:hypothetical protein
MLKIWQGKSFIAFEDWPECFLHYRSRRQKARARRISPSVSAFQEDDRVSRGQIPFRVALKKTRHCSRNSSVYLGGRLIMAPRDRVSADCMAQAAALELGSKGGFDNWYCSVTPMNPTTN